MKWMKIAYIKEHSRIDFDCEDALLEQYVVAAENTILALCNRSFESIVDEYGGEVPADLYDAVQLLVDAQYNHRSPVSMQNLSIVPYGFDLLIKKFMVLAGEPAMNDRNRLIDVLQDENTNINFFAADDTSDEKAELQERIASMWRKFIQVDKPTPRILASMRQQVAQLQADVKTYLDNLNKEEEGGDGV